MSDMSAAGDWLKSHRKIIEWEWYSDSKTFHVFHYLLHTANYKPTRWRGASLEPGQNVKSLETIAAATGLSVQNVRTSIKKLISTQSLTQSKHGKFSIITVTNWKSYQNTNTIPNSELTMNQQRSNSELTPHKEGKKVGREEKIEDTDVSLFGNSEPEMKIDFDEIQTRWNDIARTGGIQKSTKLTPQRKTLIKARLNEYSPQDIDLFFEKVRDGPHLHGENKSGWRADIGWAFKAENFLKVIEGNYDKRQGTNGNGKPKPTRADQFKDAIERKYGRRPAENGQAGESSHADGLFSGTTIDAGTN